MGEIAVVESPVVTMLAVVARAAADPGVDVAKMEALLRIQRELMADQARAEFNTAFARLSAKLPRVKKNGTVELGSGKGSYPFAKWEDIDRIIRPMLAEEGFGGLTFESAPRQGDGGGLIVTGTLLHSNGHSRSASIPLPLDSGPGRNNLQAMGSTLSYGKRYAAEMLLNIVREGEDDDGVAGGKALITAAQVKEVNDLLMAKNGNLDRFCKFMGIEAIPDIEQRHFALAMNALNSWDRRQAKT